MMKIVLVASNNAHKVRELQEIFALAGMGKDVHLLTPHDLGIALDPEETAETYRDNALIKARASAEALRNRPHEAIHASLPHDGDRRTAGIFVLADDSGLEVDALSGRPGVRSSRYHANARDGDGCAALLAEMADVPADRRSARFRCAVALITPHGEEHIFEGTCEGQIGYAKRGQYGFGFDPIFLVGQDDRTMAQLAPADKHRISHRGIAVRQVADFLRRLRDGD